MGTPDVGVLYCVNSARNYRLMLDLSIRSLKRFHPGWPVKVVELQTGTDIYDLIWWFAGGQAVHIARKVLGRLVSHEDPIGARVRAMADKIEPFARPPFAKTLYLDCDTFILRPLSGLMDIMDGQVDIIVNESDASIFYEPVAGYTDRQVPRVNSGVAVLSPRFGRLFRPYVEACPIPLSHLLEPDQYLLNYCLADCEELRTSYVPDLQLDNSFRGRQRSGVETAEDVLELVCAGEVDACVFHYIARKRNCYRRLRRLVS